jgi:hypothetical protein
MLRRLPVLPLVALAGLTLLPACGKRGDPLPPLRRRPQPATDLRLAQRGDRLELRFVTPRTTTEGQTLPVFEVELLRADQPGELTLVRTLRAAPGESLVESEPLPPVGTTVRYQVRARLGREISVPTPTATLTVQPLPPAPRALRAQLTPRGVRLEWEPPPPPPEPTPTPMPTPTPAATTGPPAPVSTPAATPVPSPAAPSPSPAATPQAAGSPSPGVAIPGASPAPTPAAAPTPPPFPGAVWLFRRAQDGRYGDAIAQLPITAAAREDAPRPLGTTFCYVARTLYSASPLVESADTPEVCLEYRDIAAPAAPLGVAVVVAEGQVEVSWSPSPEADLAGYRVYRGRPGQAGELVGSPPATETLFREAIPGQAEVVAYAVSAVDQAGNESPPSPAAEVRLR